MIPEWRRVRYADDGNAIFECLSCYVKFGAPDMSLGYTIRETNEYKPIWKFCPFCGIQWERKRWENFRREFRDSLYDYQQEYERTFGF